MNRAVADTHALIWYLARPKRLGRAASRLFLAAESGRARIFVPSVLLVELALLRERGRKVLGVAEVLTAVAQSNGLDFAPFDLPEAREFALLSSLPDPFDRMVVATARALGCPLITADDVVTSSGLASIVWD
jgi:PIN domain nuclease of toxin-antitoxin system